jgi:Zn-finger nucleic acid-binding protein
MECEYCHHTLSSKSALNYHQKTAKYCLALRGTERNAENYVCPTCDKSFTLRSSLQTHIRTCKIIKQKDLELRLTELESIIADKDKKIREMNEKYNRDMEHIQTELTEYKTRCIKAETTIENMNSETQFLRGITEKASTRTTNMTKTTNIQTNNIINNIGVFNKTSEDIDRIFQQSFDRNYLIDGQKGVAQFTKLYILEQTANKPKVYLITDRSRYKAIYKNPNGEICVDYGMQGLTRKIHPSAKKKSLQIVREHENTDLYDILSDRYVKISEMTDNNGGFRQEMIAETSVSSIDNNPSQE